MRKKPFILLGLASCLFFTACNNNKKQEITAASANNNSPHPIQEHGTGGMENNDFTSSTSQQQEPAAQLPDFKFYQVKSGFGFEKNNLEPNRNTLFILFDPSCSHCQQEAGLLSKNYNKLKDINIVYVSMNDPSLMVNFLPTFGKELDGKSNVHMLYDRDQNFIQKIHIPDIFPANYVYGPDGKLKSYWIGDRKIEEIIAAATK